MFTCVLLLLFSLEFFLLFSAATVTLSQADLQRMKRKKVCMCIVCVFPGPIISITPVTFSISVKGWSLKPRLGQLTPQQ